MGLNDDQLSGAEHDAMRSRLLSGAKRIKPAGAHRKAITTTTVAVALVALLSGSAIGAANFLRADDHIAPVVTPTPSPTATPTTTSTPAPSLAPTPPQTAATPAVVPFGGDCSRVVGEDRSVPDRETPASSWDLTNHSSSAALLGGLVCSWPSDGVGEFGYSAVSVYPASVITPELAARWSVLNCTGVGYICETGRFEGDLWIAAGSSRMVSAETDQTEQERSALEATLTSMIDTVAENVRAERAVPASRDATWWTLPKCAALFDTVATEVPVDLESGFPGDSIPGGLGWEILVAAGVMDWCSWFENAEDKSTIVELYEQVGVGAPSDQEVAASEFSPTEVSGADSSWIYADALSSGSFTVVAVSGPNRLTVRFSGATDEADARSLAAAVLERLG